MKMFKKFTQMALVAGLLIGGLAVNAPSADAKVVASGKTTAYFNNGKKIKQHTYSWDQKKVGKYTYHTVKFTSPYVADKRQVTKVMMFKIDSKGVQKQVRDYNFITNGKKKMEFTVKSKTSSKGKYFYFLQTRFPFEEEKYDLALTKTKTVTVK